METRSRLIAAISTLIATYVAYLLLDVGGPTLNVLGPVPWTTNASTSDDFIALGASTHLSSVHDLVQPLQRIAFGSCNDQSMEQPLWKNIAAYTPELWLWMGDNVRSVACMRVGMSWCVSACVY